MEKTLPGTSLTGEEIAKHLKEALGPTAILQSIDATKIGIGEGFISDIFRVKLTWGTEDENFPASVVVKLPASSLDGFLEVGAESENGGTTATDACEKYVPIAYNTECTFYRMLKDVEESPIKMPKCYKAIPVSEDSAGMIILEDFSDTAAIWNSVLDGLTYQQVLSAITEIAHFHAWSLTTDIEWRSRFPSLEDQADLYIGFLSPILPGLKTAKETYPDLFGSIDLDKVSRVISWDSYSSIMAENRRFMPDVISHGDFHRRNLLFEKGADGSLGDTLAAIIDFQCVAKASPAFDIAQLLCLGIPAEIRREHTNDILSDYYKTAKSIAGEKFSMTFEQLQWHYMRLLGLQAISAVAWAPVLVKISLKSEGEQRQRDEHRYLARVKALYDDALEVILDS